MKWNTLYSSRIESMGHSDVAAMLKLAERPEIISFAGGLPDPEVFLMEEMKDIFAEVLSERGRAALGYGAGPSFYHNQSGKEHMRLCYSYVPDAQIEEGIRRLASLVSSVQGDDK